MTFKDRLREEMKFQGLTVKELSAKSGISANTLNMYLSYRGTMPLAETALKIARALGVPLEHLVFGNDAPVLQQRRPAPKAPTKKALLQGELAAIASRLSERQLKNFVQIAKIFADTTEK